MGCPIRLISFLKLSPNDISSQFLTNIYLLITIECYLCGVLALVERLKKALEQETGLSVESTLLQDGVHHVFISNVPLHILIYADHLPMRINPPDGAPTIHLDRDVLEQQFYKVVSRVATRSGFGIKIHARHTVVARIDKRVALEFQEEHHLQVALPGKYRYGLFKDGELVSIAVFSGGRKMDDCPDDYRSFELLRFCHKNRLLVIGGLSKLLNAFRKDFDPGDIMTYVDRDWSQDSALKSIGFMSVATVAPQIYLLEAGTRKQIQEPIPNILLPEDTEHSDTFVKHNSGSTKMILFLKGNREHKSK